MLAFQDYYPDHLSHCYGCGRLNTYGLQIKSYWESDAPDAGTVCTFRPRQEHTSIPGYVYGGLIASLVDCHGTGSAAAAVYRFQGRAMETLPALRFVTASLKVDYLKPTPMGAPLVLHGQILEIAGTPPGRKVVIAITVGYESPTGERTLCARGEVTAVQVPENWLMDTNKESS